MKSFSSLPYFKCTAIQTCYSLFMLLHRVRAETASNRLSLLFFGCQPGVCDGSSRRQKTNGRVTTRNQMS
ncbi:hypothetical protein BDV29DRAFT_185304 [Aspergillus leporis]|uniref:Uncharacterized protein n=1 Tax=Aspergillus leporis TaxID=41062 RepID=A0A5N5WL06_9EURO|nr:hypothetical protein BDV29DRAFT_185304 [Aspergillus leporis]